MTRTILAFLLCQAPAVYFIPEYGREEVIEATLDGDKLRWEALDGSAWTRQKKDVFNSKKEAQRVLAARWRTRAAELLRKADELDPIIIAGK